MNGGYARTSSGPEPPSRVVKFSQKDIMCPFFREPCLRERCTAYVVGTEPGTLWREGTEVAHIAVRRYPAHCLTLRVDLPEVREKEEYYNNEDARRI